MTDPCRPAGAHLGRRFYHLAATETWERFSLHGVKALLTLYLIDHVLVGDIATVPGLRGLKAGMETVTGPLTSLAFASQIYGLYAALSYLMLPFAGAIGDRLVGRRPAIVLGAGLIATGHVCLMTEALLLPALALLILGTGCMKANLSAQVGSLFPAGDGRRASAFVLYLGFLNAGVMLGPLACGLLAQLYGWSWAFGAAAGGMVVALAIYLTTPADPGAAIGALPARSGTRAAPGIAIVAILIVVLAFCAYEQVSNIFLVWIAGQVRMEIAGFAVPPAWFAAADGLFTILLVLLGTALERNRVRRGRPALPVGLRMAGGCAAIAGGFVVLAVAAMTGIANGGVALIALVLLDAGVVLLWPAGLAIVTAATPAGSAGAMVGLFYLHGFFANLVVGWVGGWYERVPLAWFWAGHAAMAGAALLLALLFARRIDQATTQSTVPAAER